jgi:hypothetical protein
MGMHHAVRGRHHASAASLLTLVRQISVFSKPCFHPAIADRVEIKSDTCVFMHDESNTLKSVVPIGVSGCDRARDCDFSRNCVDDSDCGCCYGGCARRELQLIGLAQANEVPKELRLPAREIVARSARDSVSSCA